MVEILEGALPIVFMVGGGAVLLGWTYLRVAFLEEQRAYDSNTLQSLQQELTTLRTAIGVSLETIPLER